MWNKTIGLQRLIVLYLIGQVCLYPLVFCCQAKSNSIFRIYYFTQIFGLKPYPHIEYIIMGIKE